MSLAGRLGKALLNRMEALPGVQEEMERAERTAPVIRVGRNVAYGSLDDEKVKAMLCERPEAEPKVVDEALTHFRWRDDYIGDCTYHLLAAAASATTVASILPERAELFMQEESIGPVPIEHAFQRLAEIEPRLLDVKQEAHALDAGKDAQGCGLPKHLRQSLGGLVGGGASSDHELLHTSLATSIVYQYLEQLTGNTRLGSPSTAYFDSPTKHFVATGVWTSPAFEDT
jgi:hypothetical protein